MNPTLAMVFSLLFPGLGQFYSRQRNRAMAFFVSVIAWSVLYPPLGIGISVFAAWEAFAQARKLRNNGYQNSNLKGALIILGIAFITGILMGFFGPSIFAAFERL